MFSSTFLILIFSILSTVVIGTKLTFEADLLCDLPHAWCYSIQYLEEDDTAHDTITNVDETCVKGNQKIITTGEQSGDGWFNNHYEFIAVITHTCTLDGSWKRDEREILGDFPVSASELVIPYSENVTNKKFRKYGASDRNCN